jgi:distribution and morphology protein 34
MAFNFNWSPLTADAEFYTRAQDMLTTALNKNPKPPIIVDDIVVNELNLGSVPPDLEILEIGDLAEDRFRGIFKMCYSGDAFLTLKTRVQANPMNTYLSSKPSFTSPGPLAANSGLTIPLQITLSEIKLSAFIILVFSKQKGLTLVFRNDPLESIKVSSTFDSIPFVYEYLQKTIENQLRALMMDELPAIIHRLSLRLWCPEYAAREEEERLAEEKIQQEETAIDPLASPPQDAVDAQGNVIDVSEISEFTLEGGVETHSMFSQKNLLRLGVLTDSQRTLSLFTPGIRDAVFRAWAGPAERGDGIEVRSPPNLTRTNSAMSNAGGTTYTFSDHGIGNDTTTISRPPLVHTQSATTGLSLGSGRKPRSQQRKKKHRVVNLRKKVLLDGDTMSEAGSSMMSDSETSSVLGGSEPIMTSYIPEEREELITPPGTPTMEGYGTVRFRSRLDSIDLGETPRQSRILHREQVPTPAETTAGALHKAMDAPIPSVEVTAPTPVATEKFKTARPTLERSTTTYPSEKSGRPASEREARSVPLSYVPYDAEHAHGAGIIEQAWMMSMAAELARRAHMGKASEAGGFWEGGREETPPPAYGA